MRVKIAILIGFFLLGLFGIGYVKRDILSRFLEVFLARLERKAPFEVLEDFEEQKNISQWEVYSAELQQSTSHLSGGKFSGKVTFFARREAFPRIVLEDSDFGPRAKKDWREYARFAVTVYNPHSYTIVLYVQIKDSQDKRFKREFALPPQQPTKIRIPLVGIAGVLDIQEITQVNIYLPRPLRNVTLYCDNFVLERGNAHGGVRSILSLVSSKFPKCVHPCEKFRVQFIVSSSETLQHDYRAFIHIYPDKLTAEEAKKRKLFLNADIQSTATMGLPAGKEYTLNSSEITFPCVFPPGHYRVDGGLFRSATDDSDESIEKLFGHHLRLLYQGRNQDDFRVSDLFVVSQDKNCP